MVTPEVDPHVSTWLEADAAGIEVGEAELQTLWGTLEEDLDNPGWRDALTSLSTPVRMAAGSLGFALIGVLLVAGQGLRTDLDTNGWLRFGAIGGALVLVGAVTALWPLRSRLAAPAPLWPIIPVTWALLLGFTVLAPWPGVTGVSTEAHAICFGATTMAGLLATAWLALFERSVSPVPARIGLIGTGAGIGAFVFQSLYCPGVDVAHLMISHAAPTFGIATVMIGLALLLRR